MRVRSSHAEAVAAVAVLLVVAAGCASDDDQPEGQADAEPVRPDRDHLRGLRPPPVTRRRTRVAADFTASNPDTKVEGQDYPTHDAALADHRGSDGGRRTRPVPDRRRRPARAHRGRRPYAASTTCSPTREVDFGDGYTRNGLEAFSCRRRAAVHADGRLAAGRLLQHPADRPDRDRRARRQPGDPGDRLDAGRVPPRGPAARRPGVRGLYVAPDLEQVAPFIWSGGGDVVDDPDEPTTLTLSEDGSATAMEELLETGARPGDHLRPGGPAEALRARAVQGGPARHDARLPRPDAGAARAAGPQLRRDAAAAAGQRAPRSRA